MKKKLLGSLIIIVGFVMFFKFASARFFVDRDNLVYISDPMLRNYAFANSQIYDNREENDYPDNIDFELPTKKQVEKVQYVYLPQGILELDGLEHLKNLEEILGVTGEGDIKDISALRTMKKLKTFKLTVYGSSHRDPEYNNMELLSDISPLRGAESLDEFGIPSSSIRDFSALSNLKKLRDFRIDENKLKESTVYLKKGTSEFTIDQPIKSPTQFDIQVEVNSHDGETILKNNSITISNIKQGITEIDINVACGGRNIPELTDIEEGCFFVNTQVKIPIKWID